MLQRFRFVFFFSLAFFFSTMANSKCAAVVTSAYSTVGLSREVGSHVAPQIHWESPSLHQEGMMWPEVHTIPQRSQPLCADTLRN